MSILFRYLAKEIFWATLLLLMALLALFALFDLIKEFDSFGKGSYALGTVSLYVALRQPSHVAVIFPVAALMGTLFAVTRLSVQSELTVMRASGMSLTKLAGYATMIGIGFSALTFLFGEFVAPAAEDAAKRMRLSATSSVVAQEFRSGFWVKDGLSFINIQTVTLDTKISKVWKGATISHAYFFHDLCQPLSIGRIASVIFNNHIDAHWFRVFA